MRVVHHIVGTVNAEMQLKTACGLTGYRPVGGGIELDGKWNEAVSGNVLTSRSCPKCREALEKAMPARLKPPSIYTALKTSLGREPTNRELKEEVWHVLTANLGDEISNVLRKARAKAKKKL